MITMNSTIKELTANENIAAIIEEYIPGFKNYKEFRLIMGFKAKFLIGKGGLIGLTPEQEQEMIDRITYYIDNCSDTDPK